MKAKTLIKLAFRNISSRKKFYILTSAIIFLISSFLLCYQILSTNQYTSQKLKDKENYGSWYCMYKNIDDEEFYGALNSQSFGDLEEDEYTLIQNYGMNDNLEVIGRIETNRLSMCGVHILEGNIGSIKNSSKQRKNIIVNKRFFENNNLPQKINQDVTISFNDYDNNSKMLDAYIVGIYEIKESGVQTLFPTIITLDKIDDSPYQSDLVSHYAMYDSFKNTGDFLNPHGYVGGKVGEYNDLLNNLKTFIIALSLGTIIIIGITYSSLKVRSKELTLLRGIGATKKQLFIVIIIEMLIVYLLCQILSILISLGICYFIMNVLDQSTFVYPVILISDIILCTIGVFIMTFISFVIPMTNALKSALTGAFDHSYFQYFQIRYKKLRTQNTFQIAYRALMIKKRYMFILVVLLTTCMYYFASWFQLVNFDLNEKNDKLDAISDIHEFVSIYNPKKEINDSIIAKIQLLSQDIQTLPLVQVEESEYDENLDGKTMAINNSYISTISNEYQKNIDVSQIEGRFPENDDEIFMSNINYLDLTEEDIVEKSFQIGETLKIRGKDMKIVGYVKGNKITYNIGDTTYYFYNGLFMDNIIFVNAKTYQNVYHQSIDKYNSLRIFVNNQNYNSVSSLLKSYATNNDYIYSDSVLLKNQMKNSIIEYYKNNVENKMNISLITTCICLIVFSFMNYYDILNNKKEYALLRIIGTRKNELYLIQLKKAFIITTVAAFFSFVCLCISASQISLSLFLSFLLVYVLSLIIMSILYITPMIVLLKQDSLEIIGNED